MQDDVFLSIVIPAYNEERRLPKTLEEADKYLRNQGYTHEIIVVSDGSKDRTPEVVREMMNRVKNLRLIANKENNGKGYVTRQGMLEARGRYRVFADADNSTSVDQVGKILPHLEQGYDVVIGSRDIKGAVLDPPQPLYRILLGKAFGFLVSLVLWLWGIKDTQCGFKGFTAETSEKIFPKCMINRFAFDPEILLLAKRMGYKIKEIPVYWKNDPDSRVKFKSMVKMGIDLLRIRWNLLSGKYD